jgi:hypothetical protein
MVNPPACFNPGINVSSHWPGKNFTALSVSHKMRRIAVTGKAAYVDCVVGIYGLKSQQPDVVVDFVDMREYHGLQFVLPRFCYSP